jgi:hypothetical protein
VLAVFTKQKPGSTSEYGVFATVRDAGSAWGSETQLSDWFSIGLSYLPYPAIGVWPDGACLVTWNGTGKNIDPNLTDAIFWNSRPPNGSWTGQGRLSHWYSLVDSPNLGLGHDGSAAITWATKDAYQPANQQTAVMATYYPPGGPWTDPTAISGWDFYSSMSPTGLAVHTEGHPVGAVWYQSQSSDNEAIFYSQFSKEEAGGNKVYLPMVAR